MNLYPSILLLFLSGCVSYADYDELLTPLNLAIYQTQQQESVNIDFVLENDWNDSISVIYLSDQKPEDMSEARNLYVKLVERFNQNFELNGGSKKTIIALTFKKVTDSNLPNTVICENGIVNYLYKTKDSYETIHSESWSEALQASQN